MPRGANKYYVVTKGLETGIFDSWIEASSYTSGVTGAVHQSFDAYEAALDIWEKANAEGWVERLGQVSSHASMPRPLGPSASLSAICRSQSSASVSNRPRVWYVVTRGRQTGIFSTWIEANSHVDGIPDAVFQSFGNEEKAKRVYADAWVRGDIQQVLEGPSFETLGCATKNRTSKLSTPPPVKVKPKESLAQGGHLVESFGLMSLCSTPTSFASTSPTAKPSAPRQEGSTYLFSPPQRLTQHHSLPTTRQASPEGIPIARSSSERPAGSRCDNLHALEHRDRPSFNDTNVTQRRARGAVGDPPYLQGYPVTPCKQLIPRTKLLSPITSPSVSLTSLDTSSADSSHSRKTSLNTRVASSQTKVAVHSPPPESESGGSSSPTKKPNRITIPTSPLPLDFRGGTGENRGPRNRNRNAMSPLNMGLTPALVPHTLYNADFDPRSPVPKATRAPLSTNSVSFGRPSPAFPQSALFA